MGERKLNYSIAPQPGVSSQERVLAVLQSIVSHGSANLATITEELQIPRSSSHRAVQSLIEFGWVRKRSGDQAYVPSSQFLGQMGLPEDGAYTAEMFQNLMTDLREREYLHTEVALPDIAGRMRVIESTCKLAYQRGEACDLARALGSIIPEISTYCRRIHDAAAQNSLWLTTTEVRPEGEGVLLRSGVHIVGSTASIPFKTSWSDVGILSIWPVRSFSNSLSQIERIVAHLRKGEVFTCPPEVGLFYTGETK